MEEPREGLTPEEGKTALAIARRSLEAGVRGEKLPDAAGLGLPAGGPFHQRRAAFVTLAKRGSLRGCIGHVLPCEELWKSIRNNAVAAALHDRRFRPVSPSELGEISLDVSVLTPLRPIPDASGFVAGVHGVLLEVNGCRAVFLPQVATEQGWNEEQTLACLAQKAGLDPEAWRNPSATFQVFEAQVFKEDESWHGSCR